MALVNFLVDVTTCPSSIVFRVTHAAVTSIRWLVASRSSPLISSVLRSQVTTTP